MKKKEYVHITSGTPQTLPLPCLYHLACCDCSLDHLIYFEQEKPNTITMTFYRDDWMTAKHRAKEREIKKRKMSAHKRK